jgi:hypothetical protein
MPMVASMPLPSTLTSKRPIYFRCLLTLAVLIWPPGVLGQTSASDNVVVRWNAAALQGVRDSRIGPPMVARALAIVHTCIFDAWAAYCDAPKENARWPTRMKRSALQLIAR